MSLEAVMDAVAGRLIAGLATASTSGTTGLRAAYSAASTGQGGAIIPRSVDDWPVAILWAAGGELTAGNGPEPIVHQLEAQFWCSAVDAALAYQTLIPFVDRCRVLLRTNLSANDNATRVLMTGYGPPETEVAHNRPFLILPVYLEATELNPTNAYSLT